MEQQKITYKYLSIPLKIAVVGAWGWMILISINFIWGFLTGAIMGIFGP